MGLSQFPQTAGQVPSSKTTDQNGIQGTVRTASDPNPYGDRVSYGIITDVNFANYQVKVKIFGEKGDQQIETGWQPLVTQQDEIFLKWGQLRKGMHCRIHWRGKSKARRGFVEIVADENASFLKQKDKKNELETMPYKFLGGGITAF